MKILVVPLVLHLSVALGQMSQFISSNHKFAASLYKEIAKNTSGDFLVSPFSAQVVLSLVQSGAKDETAEEIAKSLNFGNDTGNFGETFKFLIPLLKLKTANKIYVKENYPIRNEFVATARDVYGADLENLDFSSSIEAASKMNKWVEGQTKNKIRDLIEPEMLNNKTRAVLINSLFFEGNWSSPFQNFLTVKKHFYISGNSVTYADTMHDFDGIYNYYESDKLRAKFLELPFDKINASMTIVLPYDNQGVKTLEKGISEIFHVANMSREVVNVALPKFKIENRLDFKPIMQSLGVTKAFVDGEADFSGIAGNKGDLCISDIVQKSFINVNEDGVEAAAATFIIKIFNRNGEPPKDFIADHPFLFYVKADDVILFVGRVMKPYYQ